MNVELGLRYEEVEQSSTGITRIPVATLWCLNEEAALGCNVFGMQLSPMQQFTDTGSSEYLLQILMLVLSLLRISSLDLL